MTAQDLETQLLKLSPGEQLTVMQALLQLVATPARGITKTPGVMGGEVCIVNTRIPVWLLVSYRQQGMSDGQILEGYLDLTAADLIAVCAYASLC